MLVQSDDDLAVTMPLEVVSCRLDELLADAVVIVELAVNDGMYRFVAIGERLEMDQSVERCCG